MSDKLEDILFKAYKEGIVDDVLNLSSNLEVNKYFTYADKIEEAYNIVKNKNQIKIQLISRPYQRLPIQ